MSKQNNIEAKKMSGKQAFVLAIKEATNAGFNALNPHFKSKYANEKACKEATDPALYKYGLAMHHKLKIEPIFHLETTVKSMDGENIESSYFPLMISKPQDMGSQITYARRYNRCALMGIIADEDDDGNAAQDTKPNDFVPITKEQVKIIENLLDKTKSKAEGRAG